MEVITVSDGSSTSHAPYVRQSKILNMYFLSIVDTSVISAECLLLRLHGAGHIFERPNIKNCIYNGKVNLQTVLFVEYTKIQSLGEA